MGNRKKLREKFFAEHPSCCFCGGAARAVEEDHFPSRALFDDRQWPEGYVFPACKSCNRVSRREETVIAFLSRLYSGEFNNGYNSDFEKYSRSIEREHPGLLSEMLLSPRQARDAIKKYNINVPEGHAKATIPLLGVNNNVMNDAVIMFGRKLLLALYYKHAGVPLSKTGGIAIQWYTNLEASSSEIPSGFETILSGMPELKRCNTSLTSQFSYKYCLTKCKGGAAFLVNFRSAFAIAGFVYYSANRMLKNVSEDEIYQPFASDIA
jgi:hypothetical protein